MDTIGLPLDALKASTDQIAKQGVTRDARQRKPQAPTTKRPNDISVWPLSTTKARYIHHRSSQVLFDKGMNKQESLGPWYNNQASHMYRGHPKSKDASSYQPKNKSYKHIIEVDISQAKCSVLQLYRPSSHPINIFEVECRYTLAVDRKI